MSEETVLNSPTICWEICVNPCRVNISSAVAICKRVDVQNVLKNTYNPLLDFVQICFLSLQEYSYYNYNAGVLWFKTFSVKQLILISVSIIK